MSKSKGNGVDPSPIIEQYGPDTLRHFILFIALPEKELEWSDQGIEASFKFLMRVSKLLESVKYREEENSKDHYVTSITHKTVKKVTEYLEEFKLSLALGTLMELTNKLAEYKEDPVYKETFQEALQTLVLLLSPFTPHLSEELWEQLGQKGFCSLQEWPEFDEGKIDVEAEAGQSFIQETVRDIRAVLTLAKIDKPKKVRLFVAENWKYDYVKLLKGQMEKTRNLGEILKILMASDLREYSQEISKLTPKFVKDPSKLPQVVLTQDLERKQLTESQSELEKELGCSIEVQRVEDSQETKAKQALPGKPAIVVE